MFIGQLERENYAFILAEYEQQSMPSGIMA